MDREFHISSLLVHVRPELIESVSRAIRAIPAAEIQRTTAQGKMIVTLEAPRAAIVANAMSAIADIHGVLSSVLVYHEID